MNEIKIKEYWLSQNDDGSYSMNVKYDGYEVIFNNTNIEFASNGVIAFPIAAKVIGDNDKPVGTFSVFEQSINQANSDPQTEEQNYADGPEDNSANNHE